MKKSAIAIATIIGLTSASASAMDYFFKTGRSLGYGSAGTTYAHWSAAANHNPALIGAAAGTDEDFFLVLNGSINVVEQGDTIDSIDAFTESSDRFNESDNVDLLEGEIEELQKNVDNANELVTAIEDLNGIGVNGNVALSGGLGMSFEKFAISFQMNTQLVAGGTALVAENDSNYLRRFTQLSQVLLDDVRPLFDEKNRLESELLVAQQQLEALEASGTGTDAEIEAAREALDDAEILFIEAEQLADNAKATQVGIESEFGDIFDSESQSVQFDDQNLESSARFVAIGWFEAGMTIGRNWQLDSGKTLSVGTTVKSVHLEFYDYQASIAGFDEDDIDGDDYRNSTDFLTADIGAILALDTQDKWRVGLTVKNINGVTIKSNPVRMREGQEELIFKVEPQVRIGTSYNGGWYRLAADLDVTESKGPHYADGTEFFQGTQYASLGAVINAWDFIELRAGYRHNLISEDDLKASTSDSQGLITAGAGIFIGPVQFDLGLQASDGEVGGSLQTMITW